MKYRTVDEAHHFNFQDADIIEIGMEGKRLVLNLGHVTILPENTCNRDIREMGTDEMVFQIQNAEIVQFVKEGYKVYDADGNLKESFEDRTLGQEEYGQAFKQLAQGAMYDLQRKSLEDTEGCYEYDIYLDEDATGRTYRLTVRGKHDIQEWDRFMNRESSY